MMYLLIYNDTNHYFDDYNEAISEYEKNGGILLKKISENVYDNNW